jgi:hypothetical protein
VWLATQNPVDIDYKALGNAGVKLIGRLITERDRERALEGFGIARREEAAAVEDLVTSLAKREFVLHDVRAKAQVRTLASRWAMSYLRGPVTVHEMAPLLARYAPSAVPRPGATPDAGNGTADAGAAEPRPPVLATDVSQRFGRRPGPLTPHVMVHNKVTIERRSLALLQTREELWEIPVGEDGTILWDEAAARTDEPELAEQPPAGAVFPTAAPQRLAEELRGADRSFVRWRARRHVHVLANTELGCAAAAGESREAFVERCLDLADRADDDRQEKARQRFEKKIETIRDRIARERDELERDRAQLDARRQEERLGMVEGLFSVLLGSRSLRTAAGKATTKIRTAATKRRLRRSAEGSVTESVHEIERLEDELEELADELAEAVDGIAAESEAKARAVEEVPVRPQQADVAVRDLTLVWR